MTGDDPIELDEDGLPKGRDCPTCGAPLEPGPIDATLAVAWMCPNHGPVEFTADPFGDD
ncbi:hypothetical protein NQ152_15840 [Microbacterium sp. zg.B48]|uniref:hypothetical protein n=1 Tax=Microbacterium sp. zg.B48 TaxID=2969408 RepID=UPI00214C1AC9|nr:hypothetical protein [Microbacterium sp. zg.B48]MCR2764978.1 hypothetical protein [Microbacterium sp. zg.B48]